MFVSVILMIAAIFRKILSKDSAECNPSQQVLLSLSLISLATKI
jgi:hypothetical protein